MVRRQIEARGIRDPRVLRAMRAVPRAAFLDSSVRAQAYDDCPLRIDAGQTISQPYIVARMLEAMRLDGEERVLEIGTGSGYAAAVLSRLVGHVWTIERIGCLAERARCVLAELGFDNVVVRHGDGMLGWPEEAPFDRIVVTAGGESVPPALREQLRVGGHLVIPVGPSAHQSLVRETLHADGSWLREDLCPVRFVPLLEGCSG